MRSFNRPVIYDNIIRYETYIKMNIELFIQHLEKR